MQVILLLETSKKSNFSNKVYIIIGALSFKNVLIKIAINRHAFFICVGIFTKQDA